MLFLDELPEFKRSSLEVLRQPLEDGSVTISRSAGQITLPCSVMLVAAMNPCPCGYSGDQHRESLHGATNPALSIQNQRSTARSHRFACEAPALRIEALRDTKPGESSASIRERCKRARSLQHERLRDPANGAQSCNARMSHAQIRTHCKLSKAQGDLLQQAMEQLSLSARRPHPQSCRTIADLSDSAEIANAHLLEAIQYRSLDRALFY